MNIPHIQILPGEHTYWEAVELTRGMGLYMPAIWDDEQRKFLREVIRNGLLPVGEYWANNGENPDADDLAFFEICPHHTQNNPGYSFSYHYDGVKCKVVVYCDKPGWQTHFKEWADKPTVEV